MTLSPALQVRSLQGQLGVSSSLSTSLDSTCVLLQKEIPGRRTGRTGASARTGSWSAGCTRMAPSDHLKLWPLPLACCTSAVGSFLLPCPALSPYPSLLLSATFPLCPVFALYFIDLPFPLPVTSFFTSLFLGTSLLSVYVFLHFLLVSFLLFNVHIRHKRLSLCPPRGSLHLKTNFFF